MAPGPAIVVGAGEGDGGRPPSPHGASERGARSQGSGLELAGRLISTHRGTSKADGDDRFKLFSGPFSAFPAGGRRQAERVPVIASNCSWTAGGAARMSPE